VDETVDPNFDEDIAIEVIERGSAVHCVSAYEGDIVVLGSDGVFDNLFTDEIVTICDEMLPDERGRGKFRPTCRNVLGDVAKRIVKECHAKTQAHDGGRYADTPIGRGGKIDDTCCVVGEVVEWTSEHGQAWSELRRRKRWSNVVTCGGIIPTCHTDDGSDDELRVSGTRNYPSNPNASFSTYWGSFSDYGGSFASIAHQYSQNKSFSEYGQSFPSQAGSFSDYGSSFASGTGMRSRRKDMDEEDDDSPRCSVM